MCEFVKRIINLSYEKYEDSVIVSFEINFSLEIVFVTMQKEKLLIRHAESFTFFDHLPYELLADSVFSYMTGRLDNGIDSI